ncbi:MAG: tRNA (N(6)-L-threonylcarbamoyladenosine(37)-C(2))-methylthiotransferase MtaB [Oligoflexales bacterium]|nr:tRNA (N(6)-L-threonylcarbamoyladenosine(37)-C(2))-methylthiotransferase MtaB [Oligoflexales bacterium]
MPSFYIKTMGCKVNAYDTHRLETQFKDLGYERADDTAGADIIVLNTCSVTANADREALYLLRKYRRENPNAIISATGCFAETDDGRLPSLDCIDYVFSNKIKESIAGFLHKALSEKNPRKGRPMVFSSFDDLPRQEKNEQPCMASGMIRADTDQTRSFLKIQDGCDSYCSYCIVPYARGASRSVPYKDVISEIRRLIDKNAKEIVLTGIHIGNYGKDLKEFSGIKEPLNQILREILSWDDMCRLRLSSIEPLEVNAELLEIASKRKDVFCDHFHISLQSGSDRTLGRMERPYTTRQFTEKLETVRSFFPDAFVSTDMIAGFPGETYDDFEESYSFARESSLNHIHVFPYSDRPMAKAHSLPDHIPANLIKLRTQRLRGLSESLNRKYREKFIGKYAVVLWENTLDSAGRRIGHTLNYLEAVSDKNIAVEKGMISRVLLKELYEDGRFLACHVIE